MNDRDLSKALRSLESSDPAPAALLSAGQIYQRAELRQRRERKTRERERGEKLAHLGRLVGVSALLGALFFALGLSLSSAVGGMESGLVSVSAGRTLVSILAAAGPCLLLVSFAWALRES